MSVQIKLLEWSEDSCGNWFSESPFGSEFIQKWKYSGIDKTVFEYEGTNYDTVEAAKAAAQADYETRILSALISSPGKDGGQEVEAAILDVIAERKRQIAIGYDAAHDDKHRGGEIIQAEWGVMRRIDDAIDAGRGGDSQAYMRFLTQAAAQLVAEVGRVKRALAKEAAR